MADIVISIVAKVAESLVGPAIREGKYFLCVNQVVRDLEKERQKLITERDSLQDRVEQALKRTEVIEEPVEKWLDDVRKLVEEVAGLEQKMKANSSCFQGRFPTWRRYSLCKEMIRKKEEMGKLKDKSHIEPFSHPSPLPVIQYLSSPDFMFFKSTKVACEKLVEALKDACIYMIGVSGMGGCGKTTLVTKVGKMAEESNMFDKVIFITVSQTPTISHIQGKFASQLSFKLDEDSEDERAQRLLLRNSTEKKRILVLVDDLWDKFDLNHIGIRFDILNKGTWKILVTARNQSVCTSMDCQKNIHLGLLSEEESWTLFQHHAKIDDKFSESLKGVPRKLCEECTGLPIAIETVASSLKGRKSEAEWEAALIKLRNSEEFDKQDKGVSTALSCLELSYKYLKDEEAELLFLMCSMFPEDYNIFIEDLILFAIGLGVGGRSSLKSKRSLIQAGINKLLDYCLLMHVEDMQCVKMHDLVRDAALWIAKRSENRKILVNVDNPLDTLAEDDNIRKCFAVSSWWYNEDPSFSQLDAPNLEMLFLNTRISADIFDLSGLTCERLQVFSLTHNKTYPRVPLLPPSTQLLKNVRTLRLNGLKLGDISFIVRLTTLEVLDLRGCDFNELPDEIGKLGRLKLLDLLRCHIFQNNYNGAIGKCSQLEELYASEYDREEEYLHQSIMDIVTLPKLQRFEIQITGQNISHYFKSTRFLGVRDFNISKLRKSEKNILQVAESVVLSGLHGGYKNIVPDIDGIVGGMNDLANLSLVNCPEIEYIFDTTSSSKVNYLMPRLVKLHLEEMKNLKELCRGQPLQVLCYFEKLEILEIEDCMQLHNIFPRECNLKNLKNLTIRGCMSAEVLFSTSVGQSLRQLERLVIHDCVELKYIIASGREHGCCNTSKEIVPALSPSNSHFPMPSLRKVHVYGCQKLEMIFPVCYVEGLEQLQELKIWDSPLLNYVFGECDHEYHSSHQYQNHIMLPHLEVLKLIRLQNLVGMCPDPEYCHAKWPSQSLREVTVRSCWKLDTSWIAVMTGSYQRQYRLNENLPLKLQKVALFGLPQLGRTPWQMWNLQFLQHLELVNCERLKCLFSMELCGSLPELMYLFIVNCPQLEQIVAANEEPVQLPNTEVYFPKLEEITVKSCNKLKSLFPVTMVRMLPQLSIIKISNSTQLEEVFRDGHRDGTTNQTEVVLPNLTEIVLSYLPSFVDICRGCELQAVKLQQFRINECPKIAPSLKEIQVILEEEGRRTRR